MKEFDEQDTMKFGAMEAPDRQTAQGYLWGG